MMHVILVLNAGSSSLKFQIFAVERLERQVKGQIDGIGVHPRLRANRPDGTVIVDRTYSAAEMPDLPAATAELKRWLRSLGGFDLRSIGHRVVHGGPDYDGPVLIDAPGAAFAIDHFIHRCGLMAGQLAAALDGLDAFVFTAGVGENAALIRARIAGRLAWMGAELDANANAASAVRISTASSRVTLLVVPTDEELMIARHTLTLVGASA